MVPYSHLVLQEEKAIERGILTLLQRATLVQTFGQRNHVCLKEGSITIPPYAPPQKMQTHLIPEKTPRSIFVYFRGLFYDVGNDPEGGYYARYLSLIFNFRAGFQSLFKRLLHLKTWIFCCHIGKKEESWKIEKRK